MSIIYEGTINTLNNLPYIIDDKNNSFISEEDIVNYLCSSDSHFFIKYFMGGTYLYQSNVDGKYPLLNALIAVHEVFERIADISDKDLLEKNYERNTFPFIIQLAKIGIAEVYEGRKPIEVMEQMILGK